MSLAPGARLGPYEVLSALGAGDPERIARFQREAKTLASLSHPNISAIYGLEEDKGVTALVLEFVDGPTLADRIAQDLKRLAPAN